MVLICLSWMASLVPALGLLVFFFHLSWPLALFEEEEAEEEEEEEEEEECHT